MFSPWEVRRALPVVETFTPATAGDATPMAPREQRNARVLLLHLQLDQPCMEAMGFFVSGFLAVQDELAALMSVSVEAYSQGILECYAVPLCGEHRNAPEGNTAT